MHAGMWLLDMLKSRIVRSHSISPGQTSTPGPSDMSGIEIISPQRAMAKARQFPCSIEGVGDVQTSWIGRQGVS